MSPTKVLCSRRLYQVCAYSTWTCLLHQLAVCRTANTKNCGKQQQQQREDSNSSNGSNSSNNNNNTKHEQLLMTSNNDNQSNLSQGYWGFQKINAPADVFQGFIDRFRGVTIDGKKEHVSNDTFSDKLCKSLAHWQANKYRAIWFRVYKEQAQWVPILAKAGFDFHHARTGHVVMYCWLPSDETSNLPNYAHTLLGVGSIVLNSKSEVLVVTDRYALIPNSWKLPGGYVEPREDLVDAAIREVHEETGISSTFHSIVCMRHSHGGNFGCSDIYVVVALHPTNETIKRCEREIARVKWMPVEEFLQHPQVYETNRHFLRTYLDYRERGLVLTCKRDVHQVLKREYNMYFIEKENATNPE